MKEGAIVLAFVGGLLVFAVALSIFLGGLACDAAWKTTGFDYRYEGFRGCKVEIDGVFYPSELVRVTP